jgi:hypothetical protein
MEGGTGGSGEGVGRGEGGEEEDGEREGEEDGKRVENCKGAWEWEREGMEYICSVLFWRYMMAQS